MGFNYKYHRSRAQILEYTFLPEGDWLTVKEAAEILRVSEQTIRKRYLTGVYRVVLFNGITHVCIP